jgi:thiamine kinase-like enzyme
MVGHFGIEVTYEQDGTEQVRRMVMKIKPHGNEIVEMLNSLAQVCGGKLADVYNTFKSRTGFQQTHTREQEIYKKLAPCFTPEIFGLRTDHINEVYVILMEYLENVELLNSVMQPEQWSDQHIKITLSQMAQWHASMLNTTATLNMQLWDDVPSLAYMQQLTPLWQALLDNASINFPELYTNERVQLLQHAIDNISDRWRVLEALPQTFIHNDCNPRNSCFKKAGTKQLFCLYDWELSTFHIPQYDVVEFLSFVIDADRYNLRADYIEFYRRELSKHTGAYTDARVFNAELEMAAYDFALHRIGMYMMAHTVSPYRFLPRVVNSLFDMISKPKELAL